MGYCDCYIFCCALLFVQSSFAIIFVVALLCLSSWCLVIVVWLFLMVRWACLQFVIMIFPDHTHLLFLNRLVIVSSSEGHSEEYVSEETTNSFFESFVKVFGIP